MKRYWVVGGEYADTDFTVFAAGKSAERLGPFDSYNEALKVWSGKAWGSVDSAQTRYTLLTEDADTRAQTLYWVVGGEYADTGFSRPAAGKRLERLGPFATETDAQKVWSGKAWSTVDSAMTRYRIEIETDIDQGEP